MLSSAACHCSAQAVCACWWVAAAWGASLRLVFKRARVAADAGCSGLAGLLACEGRGLSGRGSDGGGQFVVPRTVGLECAACAALRGGEGLSTWRDTVTDRVSWAGLGVVAAGVGVEGFGQSAE